MTSPSPINFVDLVESNPVTNLSERGNHKLITNLQNAFTDEDQRMFVASFYCFLDHNPSSDFIIDLDNVWRWMGFSQKIRAKNLLERHFVKDAHYRITGSGKLLSRGGHNKETILMTVKTFKKLCLKADTKKADQIQEYYLKLVEVIMNTMNEEGHELRLQLENVIITSHHEKELLREKTLLEQFPDNVQCVYYGRIDNIDPQNPTETLVKFGMSNFLSDRVKKHKKTFTNFRLCNAFKVENKVQIENAIKNEARLQRRSLVCNDTNQTELLAIESLDELEIIFKEVIQQWEYNPENYARLCIENATLKERNAFLEEENMKQQADNRKLLRRINKLPTNDDSQEAAYHMAIQSMKRVDRAADGFYHVDGKAYAQLIGTREQVWTCIAYKTSGNLGKDDLLVNKDGKIVSKKKFVDGKLNWRSKLLPPPPSTHH